MAGYVTKAQMKAQLDAIVEREWRERRAAEAARWEKGETAAATMRAAGFESAKGFFESVLLDHDDALRLVAALARVPA